MKILLLGHKGMLGSDLLLRLGRKHEVVGLDKEEIDITSLPACEKAVKEIEPEIVINAAAYTNVDGCENAQRECLGVNAEAVLNIAVSCRKKNIRIVHFSTDYVFDGRSNCPYAVACTPHPLSRYGESKVLGENFVRDLCERWFLIRTSWLFGKGKKNFARKILDRSRETKKLSIVDDRVSSPTYTVDLAKATLDLVQTDSFGLYHFSNAGICSRFDWARYILQQTRWNGILHRAKSDDLKTAAQRPAYSALDTSGTEEILGYKLPSWQDATTRYLREMRGIV